MYSAASSRLSPDSSSALIANDPSFSFDLYFINVVFFPFHKQNGFPGEEALTAYTNAELELMLESEKPFLASLQSVAHFLLHKFDS